jgi:hypothetical protein
MSIYEKRYSTHHVSAEQAERGEIDAPGMCGYYDTWAEVEHLASVVGWERITWVAEGCATYEDVSAGSKRRNSNGEYRVGMDGTIVTRQTTAVLYTNPLLVAKRRRFQEMGERIRRAFTEGRTISMILTDNDERLKGITPYEATDYSVSYLDENLSMGKRTIYFEAIQQLAC